MLSRTAHFLLLVVAISAVAQGADVEGRIVIKRRLTKRTITAAASSYQRGAAVLPPPPISEDPLAFERTRVVIYLEGQFSSDPVAATLEQINRRFVPDLTVVPVGSTVSFPNRDAIFHNVFSLSKLRSFDLGTYPKDRTRTITLSKPGIVYVNCHLHPNMSAAIVVTPNQWYTRADASGRFLLRDVPPGRHTMVAWHKAAGFFRQVVDIDTQRTTTLSFLIPFDEDLTASNIERR